MREQIKHVRGARFGRLALRVVAAVGIGLIGSVSMANAAEKATSERVFMVEIPMRDGTLQAARVSLPPGDGPWPVVLQRFYWANTFGFGEDTFLAGGYHRGIYKPPALLTPGEPQEFTFELMPTSYLFRKGHRIRLYVSSSNFPLWDRNTNTGGSIARETKTRIAHQTIFHDRDHPSHIRLPIVRGALPEAPNTP